MTVFTGPGPELALDYLDALPGFDRGGTSYRTAGSLFCGGFAGHDSLEVPGKWRESYYTKISRSFEF